MIRLFTTLTFSLLLFSNSLYGQSRKAIPLESPLKRATVRTNAQTDPLLQFRAERDTVYPDIFDDACSESLIEWPVSNSWGFVGGNNGLFDLEKAQKLRYDPESGFLVREIWGWFATGKAVGDGNLFAKAYTLDPETQGPGDLAGISQPVKTSELLISETEVNPTIFTIQNPLTIRDTAFFASIDFSQLYAAEDTAALFMTDQGCGDGADSWELYLVDDFVWTPINSTEASWGLDANFNIAAVVEPTDLEQERLEAPVFQEACSDTLTSFFLGGDNWGPISGTNSFGDLEKAQELTFQTDVSIFVREVWGWFSVVSTVDDGEVRAKVYDRNPDADGPGALVATSSALKTSELNFGQGQIQPTAFVFEEPVPVLDFSFFASIDISDLYATSDTIALWHTQENCGDGATSWDLFSDGTTWAPVDDPNSWDLEANYLISAIIEFSTDVDQNAAFVTQKGLQLFPAFPNPAAETVNLKYRLDQTETVQIEVYSAQGQLLQKRDLGRRTPGEYTDAIDVSDLPAGAYVYGIVTDRARLMSRFVVSR